MSQFDEKTIQETAYFIWKNNGCKAGTNQSDWQEAIQLLERKEAMATAKQVSSLYHTAFLNARLKNEFQKKNSLNLMRKIILK